MNAPTSPACQRAQASLVAPWRRRICAAFVGAVSVSGFAAPPPPPPALVPPPPPVVQAPAAPVPPPAPAAPAFVYEQRPLAPPAALVKPEVAKTILDKFKAAYSKMGSPRMLVYVNRELIDEESGLKLAHRTQRSEVNRTKATADYQADGKAPKEAFPQDPKGKAHAGDARLQPGKGETFNEHEKISSEEGYRNQSKPVPALADKQTLRDVERLFGRPLRMCGAKLADQRIAAQMVGDAALKKASTPTGDSESARKEREATRQVADIVIEILISSRSVVMPGISGNRVQSVPDIQATAVRLSDAQIVGQATAADILGKDGNAAQLSAVYDVRDISEATALALMEDIAMGVAP